MIWAVALAVWVGAVLGAVGGWLPAYRAGLARGARDRAELADRVSALRVALKGQAWAEADRLKAVPR